MATVTNNNPNPAPLSDAAALNLFTAFGRGKVAAATFLDNVVIYESKTAEAAYLATHSNLKPEDVKIYNAGRYQITILAKAESPDGKHHNQPEVIIRDFNLLDKTPDTVIWGDPHLTSGAGESNSFVFNNNLDLKLQNGTDIFINTAESKPWPGHTYVTAVTISNSYNSVKISGIDNFPNQTGVGITATEVKSGPQALPDDYDKSTTITQNRDGSWSFSNGVEISALTTSLGYGIDSKGNLEWNYSNI